MAGYPSVFAHGMLTMGMTGKMLTDYVGDGTAHQVRRALHQPGVAGRHAGRHGDGRAAIRDEGGQKVVDLTISTTNQDGKEVVSGTATARLD